MYPPKFNDVECWISFRYWLNSTFYIKELVSHKVFQLIITIFIVLGFANSIVLIYSPSDLVQSFDYVFISIFMLELALRIIGLGF